MEGKTLLTLKLIGFDGHETEKFLAIFDLAERRLKQQWQIVETDSADFFLLTEKFKSTQPSQLSAISPESRIFCSNAEQAADNQSVLVDSNQVPKFSSLILVLNRMGERLSEQVSLTLTAKNSAIPNCPAPVKLGVKANDPIDAHPPQGSVFNPHQGLLKHLLQAQTEPHCAVFTLTSQNNANKIYLHSAEKIYYCQTSLKNLIPYLSAGTELLVGPVAEAQLNTEVEQAALASKPLSNLIWFVAFQLSQGRLLQGHSDQDIVYLTRWPDLGIHGCEKYVKVAAFMKNNAVSLSTVATETGFSLEQIHDFYNACHLIGLTAKTTKTETHEKTVNTDTQNLLRKIGNRLNKISNRDISG